MIITCEACGTSFKIKTSLIKETGSTVRCSKCQQVFIAYPKSSEKEKPAGFKLDESLEAKIDDFLGEESSDEFSDLESEISLETAEISMSTSEELFDTSGSAFDKAQEGPGEQEILMSELEQDDDDIVSLDSLASGATAEEDLELGAWLEEGTDDSEIVSFGDLGAKATAEEESEILSFDDIDQEDEIALDSLESTVEVDEDVIGLDDLESGASAEEEILFGETVEAEEEVDFLDFEDEEVQQGDEIEMEIEEELEDKAEPEELALEREGGVDTDLDDFDLDKKSEEEDTSEGTAEDAGKLDTEAEKPAEEVSKVEADEEEFELDFDLESEKTAEASKGAVADEDEFGLDLDLEEGEREVKSTAEAEEKDFELDFDLDSEGFEDLDLTEEPSAEVSVDEDLDLELGATAEEDLGLDLDLDEFEDLDLEGDLASVESDTGAEDEFSLDLDAEAEKSSTVEAKDDFDLDFDLEPEEAAEVSKATAEAEDFDLDFDLGDEAKEEAGVEEETFDLDLNIEPEPVGAEAESEDFDLDLDFDAGLDDASSVLAESFVDEDAGPVTKTEEFDLTQIEDVLDFDEIPEPEEVEAGGDLGVDLDESGPFTVSDEDEMSIDLETMLDEDETAADEKEVTLETVEEREKQIERDYKKTVVEEEEAPEETFEEFPEEVEEKYAEEIKAKTPAAKVGEKRNLKKILIPLILLIALGAIIYAGIQLFGAKEEAPVAPVTPAVIDQGNLQMEMIANPAYKFVENKVSGELLVVTGSVTNRYDHPRSNVEVKGTLYDNAGKVIVTSTAYCGNMLADSDLTDLKLETIKERLNNRMGDNNINAGIEPGKNIPFTVVFSNVPQDVSDLTVEVVRSAK